ncbi:Irx [Fasciola hepatica]|uniref:Irx n=1 Tax=Fasciola hepatica TaxID=6192 RepID=A0A4E0RVS9_FASHE|nr:Irx [Fasciola hepatica]
MIASAGLLTVEPELSDIPLNLSRGRRKQRHPRYSQYTEKHGFTELENTTNALQFRTNVSNQLSVNDRHSSPVGLCKAEQNDSLSEVFLAAPATDSGSQTDEVLCTPKHETAEAVSSIVEPHDYQVPQTTELEEIQDDDRQCGTPVFPPATENLPPAIRTYNNNTSAISQSFDNHNPLLFIGPKSNQDVVAPENPISHQPPSKTFTAPQLVQTYAGLGSIQGMTTGCWQQSSGFANSQQPIPQTNYTVAFPTANTYGTCLGYGSAAPTIQSWPWMVAVGQNFCACPANFGEVGHTADPSLAPALSVPIIQSTVGTITSHYGEKFVGGAHLNTDTDSSRSSAFHIVSREPDLLQGSTNLPSEITCFAAQDHLAGRFMSKPRNRKASNRHLRAKARNRSGALESTQSENTNSSSGCDFFPDSLAERKSSELAWTPPGADGDLSENSELESQNQQATCSTSSHLSSMRHRPLNRNALRQMRQWYEAHIDRPYPTTAEKMQLAELGGIKISQVNSWFANQRTRSCNTRPKKKLQRLRLRLRDMTLELERVTQGVICAADIEEQLRTIIDEYLT